MEKLDADIRYDRIGYNDCECIELPDTNCFEVVEYFMEDLKVSQVPKYNTNSDARISEETEKLAVSLVR